jgi:hypothetical protein
MSNLENICTPGDSASAVFTAEASRSPDARLTDVAVTPCSS